MRKKKSCDCETIRFINLNKGYCNRCGKKVKIPVAYLAMGKVGQLLIPWSISLMTMPLYVLFITNIKSRIENLNSSTSQNISIEQPEYLSILLMTMGIFIFIFSILLESVSLKIELYIYIILFIISIYISTVLILSEYNLLIWIMAFISYSFTFTFTEVFLWRKVITIIRNFGSLDNGTKYTLAFGLVSFLLGLLFAK